MPNPLGVHIAHGTDELREIDMGNILPHALIGLNLVEEIATLGQFHCDPAPDIIFSRRVEGDYIVMANYVFMNGRFHLQLTRTNLAMARGIFFVNEFDGDDGVIGVRGTGFFYTVSTEPCQYHGMRIYSL